MDTRVENPEDGGEVAAQRSQRKTQPAKGKRYSPAQRKEILTYARDQPFKGGNCMNHNELIFTPRSATTDQ